MAHPVQNRIGTVFVPVSNIEKARDWYCQILGLPVTGEILFGHLYVVPMEGAGLVLDAKIFPGKGDSSYPLFHFNTSDVQAAYRFMQAQGVELLGEIQHDHFFNFKDPDGNVLMVCQC